LEGGKKGTFPIGGERRKGNFFVTSVGKKGKSPDCNHREVKLQGGEKEAGILIRHGHEESLSGRGPTSFPRRRVEEERPFHGCQEGLPFR